jgi:hypothetical protein
MNDVFVGEVMPRHSRLLPFESVRAPRSGSTRKPLFLPPSLCDLCALCASVVLWRKSAESCPRTSLRRSRRRSPEFLLDFLGRVRALEFFEGRDQVVGHCLAEFS